MDIYLLKHAATVLQTVKLNYLPAHFDNRVDSAQFSKNGFTVCLRNEYGRHRKVIIPELDIFFYNKYLLIYNVLSSLTAFFKAWMLKGTVSQEKMSN